MRPDRIVFLQPLIDDHTSLKNLEHDLHTVVAFGVLPLFAGKQLGIFLLCFLAIKIGLARLPDGANWGSLYGVSILCGVGFTMSLFVGSLAFENVTFDASTVFDERLGIIVGSLLSGVFGYVVLHLALPKSD